MNVQELLTTYIEELHRGNIYFLLYHPKIRLTPRLDSGELGSRYRPVKALIKTRVRTRVFLFRRL